MAHQVPTAFPGLRGPSGTRSEDAATLTEVRIRRAVREELHAELDRRRLLDDYDRLTAEWRRRHG